eukprot:scaffold463_cov242-Pinguiococcus_pyrenoidosus.AAC.16
MASLLGPTHRGRGGPGDGPSGAPRRTAAPADRPFGPDDAVNRGSLRPGGGPHRVSGREHQASLGVGPPGAAGVRAVLLRAGWRQENPAHDGAAGGVGLQRRPDQR